MKLRKEYSAILNISSCCGVFLSPRVGVYSMTKKALDVYSRILQAENDNSNI